MKRFIWLLLVAFGVCSGVHIAPSIDMALSSRAAEPEVDQPLPPLEAARTMRVPPGFRVTLFAGEPDVAQPISFCIDDRGRLWVAEAYNYPQHGTKPGDRILIFTDEDNDGRFDKRTVFHDQLNYVTGVEVGFGGVWVVSPPYFYFIPDADGDDQPDGPPRILLDGLGNHANSHNLANALAWGPDGWLYGTHGRTNWSLIGKPGTPESERIRFDGGVYRYHPVRHVWEPFADGTTNPWGIDWNDHGDAFICNCVDPHLFQVIPGAHYEPWRNRESSRHAYERIASIADHLHFVGKVNVREGLGSAEEDEAGGGHAHCGTMVYLGDNWPTEYRNAIFMHNIHGKRINSDLPQRRGSGYVASHGRDILRAQDPWYMGVTLQYGPDGAVYSSDWSDTGECHSVKNTRRHTGRIYKIAYGPARPPHRSPQQATDAELVELQLHPNDWHVRHARRVLQERAASGRDMTPVHLALRGQFRDSNDVTRKLRALWALHVTGGADTKFLTDQLGHDHEYVRSWAIRLLGENLPLSSEATERIVNLAATGESAHNRLQIASLLQRLPSDQRWAPLSALAARNEDVDDPNLPLMNWYALEPLVVADPDRSISVAKSSPMPVIRRHTARRMLATPDLTPALTRLVTWLGEAPSSARHDILEGTLRGLEGQRRVATPTNWPTVFEQLQRDMDARVRERALELALRFNDPTAPRLLVERARDRSLPQSSRERALQALLDIKSDECRPLLRALLDDDQLRGPAIRGMAEYQESDTPTLLLALYPRVDATTRQDILQTLASRKAWAASLLDSVESKSIATSDVSAFVARQLISLDDSEITARVRRQWGEMRKPAADKARQIADLKRNLSPAVIQRGDRVAGRRLFEKTCASCHKLFDLGGAIGPELTGAQRFQIDYLLENLIDPSAAVSKDYQMQIVETTSGRVITGIIVDESSSALVVQTLNEKLVIPRTEIESRRASPLSLMPDGLLAKFTLTEIRDLLAYLSGPGQVVPEAPRR